MDEKATAKVKVLGLSLPFARRLHPPPATGAPHVAHGVRRLAGWLADRSLPILALALVGSLIAFGAYYAIDRQVDTGVPLVERQVSALEEAVRNDPGSFAARVALARAYEGTRDYPGAVEQYRAALAIEAENVQAALGLGRSLQATGDLAAAGESFEKIVKEREDTEFALVDDALRDARYYLGEIYLTQGEYAKAAESLEAALAIDSVDADAWWRLCEARLGAGQNEQAIEACERAVLLVPNFAEAYQLMAQAYEKSGKTLQARYAAAMVAYASGDASKAAGELQAVVRQDPAYWDAFVGLGLALEAGGDREEALEAYNTALAGDPDNFLAAMGVSRLGGGHP